MARYFTRASNQYLSAAISGWNYTPITLACWFYLASDIQCNLLSIGDGDTTYNLHTLQVSSLAVRVQTYVTSSATATSTTTFGLNAWHHACGVFAAPASRAVYLDGTNKGTNTTNKNPSGPTLATIGVWASSYLADYMDGRIAHAAIWEAALSDAEAAMLAVGVSPMRVRPQSLVVYWPLLRTDQDWVGGYDMTPVNSPIWADHAPIFFSPPVFNFGPAPAVGAIYGIRGVGRGVLRGIGRGI